MNMKGYKVFNPDWTCQGFQYKVGETYKMEDTPVCCKKGFHFCRRLADCFTYYDFNPENKVAEIETLGNVRTEDSKACTNEIRIIREISWEEVLKLVNTGKGCTGIGNSGDWNSGNYNSGDCNSGNWNSGSFNSGNRNSGDFNSGDFNSGEFNRGSRNSGDYNSGDWNSGDWNNTSFSNGCFNTEPLKIMMFNKPSDWTYHQWRRSSACRLLQHLGEAWVHVEDMTKEELTAHPEANTTGGYLRAIDRAEAQKWWENLRKRDKEEIKAIPNFDRDIFKEITGITVE